MRRLAACAIVLLAAWAAVAARGASPGEGRLDLVAFPGYAEAGGDDPRVNWVTPFVQQTGCKVRVRTVRSSTELLDAVTHGRYDGVAAFGDVTQVLTGGGTRSSRSTSRACRTSTHVYPALKRLPQNVEGGRVVGVPHGRGANLLLWRTDLVRPAPRRLERALRPSLRRSGRAVRRARSRSPDRRSTSGTEPVRARRRRSSGGSPATPPSSRRTPGATGTT